MLAALERLNALKIRQQVGVHLEKFIAPPLPLLHAIADKPQCQQQSSTVEEQRRGLSCREQQIGLLFGR